MEKYEELSLEIVTFESDDIITTSIYTDPVSHALMYGEEEW